MKRSKRNIRLVYKYLELQGEPTARETGRAWAPVPCRSTSMVHQKAPSSMVVGFQCSVLKSAGTVLGGGGGSCLLYPGHSEVGQPCIILRVFPRSLSLLLQIPFPEHFFIPCLPKKLYMETGLN